MSTRLRNLSTIRLPSTADPETSGRDQSRLVQTLDEMFGQLVSSFAERWKPGRGVVTINTTRPVLQWGVLTIVDSTTPSGDAHSQETILYLPRARPSDAGRRLQFVKKYTSQALRLQPTDGSLVNMFPSWGGMHQVGLHEVWWDGSGWWCKEPGSRVRRHGLEHQPLGLWQLDGENELADFSGHGRDLTFETGTILSGPMWGGLYGVRLDGSNSLIYDVADSALQLTGDMTIMWLGILQAEADNTVFFSHHALGELETQNVLYYLSFTTAPTVQWFNESGAGVDSTASLGSPVGTLHNLAHWAVTRISNAISVYINGTLLSLAGSVTAPTGGTVGRFRFGADAAGNRISGLFTSIKLLNIGLTADQVRGEYNRTMGPAFGFRDARIAA